MSPPKKARRTSTPTQDRQNDRLAPRDNSSASSSPHRNPLNMSPNRDAMADWSYNQSNLEQKLQPLPPGRIEGFSKETKRRDRQEKASIEKKLNQTARADQVRKTGTSHKPPRTRNFDEISLEQNRDRSESFASIPARSEDSPGAQLPRVSEKLHTAAYVRCKTFPEKLHNLLADQDSKDVIEWAADGNSFVILSREELVKNVLPKVFKVAKFESFVRKLNRWGFRRISCDDYKEQAVYQNKHFRRDAPEECKKMDGGTKRDQTSSYMRHPDQVHQIQSTPQGFRSDVTTQPSPVQEVTSSGGWQQNTQPPTDVDFSTFDTMLLRQQMLNSLSQQPLQTSRSITQGLNLNRELENRYQAFPSVLPDLGLASAGASNSFVPRGGLTAPTYEPLDALNTYYQRMAMLDARAELLLHRQQQRNRRLLEFFNQQRRRSWVPDGSSNEEHL